VRDDRQQTDGPWTEDVNGAASEAALDSIREGDPDALSRVYGLFAEMVYGVAYRLTYSSADAYDVTQEVFIGLPEALRHYEERGKFAAWLRKITARRALQILRDRKRRQELDLEFLRGFRSRHHADPVIERLTVERALARLSHDLRAVYVLCEIEGLSHDEAAATLGIRRNTSEVRLYRARRRLLELLEGGS
jgi:RNA polymerase sigma factor (sigma-70 family)